jgi:hypothetical protein
MESEQSSNFSSSSFTKTEQTKSLASAEEKERQRIYSKRYYEKHKKDLLERQKNTDAYKRKYLKAYQTHKEELKAKYQANRDVLKAKALARYYKKKAEKEELEKAKLPAAPFPVEKIDASV